MENVDNLIQAYQEDSTIRGCRLLTEIDDEGIVVVKGRTRNYHQKQIAIHLFRKFILDKQMKGRLEVLVDSKN